MVQHQQSSRRRSLGSVVSACRPSVYTLAPVHVCVQRRTLLRRRAATVSPPSYLPSSPRPFLSKLLLLSIYPSVPRPARFETVSRIRTRASLLDKGTVSPLSFLLLLLTLPSLLFLFFGVRSNCHSWLLSRWQQCVRSRGNRPANPTVVLT